MQMLSGKVNAGRVQARSARYVSLGACASLAWALTGVHWLPLALGPGQSFDWMPARMVAGAISGPARLDTGPGSGSERFLPRGPRVPLWGRGRLHSGFSFALCPDIPPLIRLATPNQARFHLRSSTSPVRWDSLEIPAVLAFN